MWMVPFRRERSCSCSFCCKRYFAIDSRFGCSDSEIHGSPSGLGIWEVGRIESISDYECIIGTGTDFE